MGELFPQYKNLKGQSKLLEVYDQALAKLWPVPCEELDIRTDYGTVHVLVSGKEDAPPLFLLHGRSSTSLHWYQVAEKLGGDFRIYSIDVLGDWGKSVPQVIPETEEQAAACLEQVMLAVGIREAFVAGLSYGGFLSMNLALKKASRVKKLMLLAPAATILPLSFRFWYVTMKTIFFPTKRNVAKNIRTFAQKGNFGNSLLTELRYYGFRYGSISTMKVRPRVFTDRELSSLSMPVMLLVGEQEMIYDPAEAINRAVKLIPGCRGELIPECGHAIYTDQPEILSEKIREFLLSR